MRETFSVEGIGRVTDATARTPRTDGQRCSSPRNARLPKFYEHSTENDKGTGAALSSDGGDFLGPLSLSSALPQIRLTGGVSREIGGGVLKVALSLRQFLYFLLLPP